MSNDPRLPLQIQAVLNRLQARLGSGLADAAATLLAAAEAAPNQLTQEWSLFWQEVELEAERLEHGSATGGPSAETQAATSGPNNDPQQLIDNLRARVAAISQHLDA